MTPKEELAAAAKKRMAENVAKVAELSPKLDSAIQALAAKFDQCSASDQWYLVAVLNGLISQVKSTLEAVDSVNPA